MLRIENYADDNWYPLIKYQADLVLASVHSSVPNITVKFSILAPIGAMPKRFRCDVKSPDLAPGNCQIAVEHPNGHTALEGALLRFKRIVAHSRQVNRISKYKSPLNH